jgi:hypothetical protein
LSSLQSFLFNRHLRAISAAARSPRGTRRDHVLLPAGATLRPRWLRIAGSSQAGEPCHPDAAEERAAVDRPGSCHLRRIERPRARWITRAKRFGHFRRCLAMPSRSARLFSASGLRELQSSICGDLFHLKSDRLNHRCGTRRARSLDVARAGARAHWARGSTRLTPRAATSASWASIAAGSGRGRAGLLDLERARHGRAVANPRAFLSPQGHSLASGFAITRRGPRAS